MNGIVITGFLAVDGLRCAGFKFGCMCASMYILVSMQVFGPSYFVDQSKHRHVYMYVSCKVTEAQVVKACKTLYEGAGINILRGSVYV